MRRSKSAPSGLVYHVRTPSSMAKYLEKQKLAPDHLKDFYCLDESHRSINDYCPSFGTGPSAPSNSSRIFISEGAADADVKRCTAFNAVDDFNQLLSSDRPQATFQVTRFSDGTIITLSASHALGDLVTTKGYFRRWEAALYGKPIEPLYNVGVDPYVEYRPGGEFTKAVTSSSPATPPPGWRVLGMLDKARFLTRYLWDYYVSRPERTIQSKRIFIPESQIKALEDRAHYDLSLLHKSLPGANNDTAKPPFVSRSDVVYAWLLKHSHAHLPPSQESTALTISNGRFRPPAPLKAGSDELVNNDFLCAAMAITIPSFTAGDIAAMPLGELALRVRNGIKANASPENIKDWLVFHLFHNRWQKPSGQTIAPCESHHFITGITDWSLIHLEQLDFTPARLDGDSTIPAIPCAIDGHMVVNSSRRDFYICHGYVDGGIWIVGYASEAQWNDPTSFGKYDTLQLKPGSKL